MSLLARLHQGVSVAASQSPASEADIEALAKARPGVPSEYLDLVREATEVELSYGDHFLRIWGPAGVEEMDATYGVSVAIPGAIPVGDDEGGSALVYMEGSQGQGLYLVGLGDLDRDDAVWMAPDLEALLCQGAGLEKLDPDRRY